MGWTVRKALAIIVAAFMLVILSACGNTSLDQVEKDAQFAKTCKDNGGRVWENEYGLRCSFGFDE